MGERGGVTKNEMETSSTEKKEMLYNRYYDRYDTIAVSALSACNRNICPSLSTSSSSSSPSFAPRVCLFDFVFWSTRSAVSYGIVAAKGMGVGTGDSLLQLVDRQSGEQEEKKKKQSSSRVTNVLKGAVIGASAIAYRVPGMIPDHE